MRKLFLLAETNFNVQPGYILISNIANEVSKSLGSAYPELIDNNEKVNNLYVSKYKINYLITF